MKISKQSRRDAKELFRSSQVDGVLDPGRVRQIVDQVLAHKPRGYVGTLAHFQRLIKLDLDRRAARIETVIPLDERAQNNLKVALAKRYGAGLDFTFAQNAGLIGGMRIKVGSDVYDGSIQSRLEQLKESI